MTSQVTFGLCEGLITHNALGCRMSVIINITAPFLQHCCQITTAPAIKRELMRFLEILLNNKVEHH